MSAKKRDDAESGLRNDSVDLEGFVSGYLTAYRNHIIAKGADERHLPQFFKQYPFSIDVHRMPNGSVCALFKRGNRSKVTVLDGDFEAVQARLRDQDFDFMQAFPPFTIFSVDEASRLARLDADKDMRMSRRLELLAAAEGRLTEIHDDIHAVVELNPWLDQQTAEQKRKLDQAKELILELYREVDISKEERFVDYAAQLADVMAFEKGDLEEVAGEMSMEVEAAMEEVDRRVSDIESGMSDIAADLKAALGRLKALEKNPAGPDEAVSELEEGLKSLSKAVSALKSEFEGVREDAEASKEFRETVFRDSKRTYNLNERVTDLERAIATLKSDASGSARSEVKALEGRINILERDLREYVRQCVEERLGTGTGLVTTGEPIVETTVEDVPGSPGVKKTVKRTTTKKTTRTK